MFVLNKVVNEWMTNMNGGSPWPNDNKGTRYSRRRRKKQGKYSEKQTKQKSAYSKIESLSPQLKKSAYSLIDSENDELLDAWTGSNGRVHVVIERYDDETGNTVTETLTVKNSKENKKKNISVIKVLGKTIIKDIFSNNRTTIREIPKYVNNEQFLEIYREFDHELTNKYSFSNEQTDEIIDRIEDIAGDIGTFGKTNPWPFVYNTINDIYDQLDRYDMVAGDQYNATIAYEALIEELSDKSLYELNNNNTFNSNRQKIGENLFPKIKEILNSKNENINKTGKITGMLLELNNKELNSLTKNKNKLKNRVDEAISVLKNYSNKNSQVIKPWCVKHMKKLTETGVSEKINLNTIQKERKRKKAETAARKKKAEEKVLLAEGIINTGNYNEKDTPFKQTKQTKQKTVKKETNYENANNIEKLKKKQEKEKERIDNLEKASEKFRKDKIKKEMEKLSPEKIKKQQKNTEKAKIKAKKTLLRIKRDNLKKKETTKQAKEKKKENTTNINNNINNLKNEIAIIEKNLTGGGKKVLIRKNTSVKKTLQDKRRGKYKHKNHTHKTKKAMEKCTI